MSITSTPVVHAKDLENDDQIHTILRVQSCTKPSIFHDKSESALTVVLAREFIKQCNTDADLQTVAKYLPFTFTGMRSGTFEARIPATIAQFIHSKEQIKFEAQEALYILTPEEGTGISKGVAKQRAELTIRIGFEPQDPFSNPTAAATNLANEWICNIIKHAGLKPLDVRRAKNELGAFLRIYYADFEVPGHFHPSRLHEFAHGKVKTESGHHVEFHFPKPWTETFNICGVYRCLECHPCACDRKRDRGGPSHNGGHAQSAKRAKLAALMHTQGSME